MPTYNSIAAKVDIEDEGDIEAEGDGKTFLVRSPAVGVADGVPAEGSYLNPLEGFLTLRVLSWRYVVKLPRNVQGRVVERFIEDTYTPVGYGQPLFRLGQVEGQWAGAAAEGERATAGEGVDADLIPVQAPSEGIFYRRPTPDSPPYVEEGSAVSAGSTLGLVEVMKSFNQITYGGPGLPDHGTVARILAEDTSEVSFGQTLFLIKPA